jgi:hypothetical protein
VGLGGLGAADGLGKVWAPAWCISSSDSRRQTKNPLHKTEDLRLKEPVFPLVSHNNVKILIRLKSIQSSDKASLTSL